MNPSLNVFKGFVFSQTEPSALEQLEGGPCAVIAPVQVCFTDASPAKHLTLDKKYIREHLSLE